MNTFAQKCPALGSRIKVKFEAFPSGPAITGTFEKMGNWFIVQSVISIQSYMFLSNNDM